MPRRTTAGRKLAAILHADVAGYSRLMGDDEAGTHARLMAYRQTFEEVIPWHGGRIVGTAGDAVLADFPSVVMAISAAAIIQDRLKEKNAAVSAAERLHFRIGINLGDVIVDGSDIFGEGVNVAARVETLAEPGGIAVSGAVYDQVRGNGEFAFRDGGTHRVKNIAEPIRVYALVASSGAGKRSRAHRHRLRRAVVASIAVVIIASGAAAWFWVPIGEKSNGAVAEFSGNSPDATVALREGKPTIAVLPFENRSTADAQAYFSDGVTEDVITDLGRFSNLLVLSWSAVAPYKDRSVTPEQLSNELDVSYVVGGTVRRADDRLRITVQLTDAERGVLLWSERYDENLQDVFAVQARIARQVVRALSIRLTELERVRAFAKPTNDLDAYDHVLRARHLVRRVERDANLDARGLFEKAIKIDPQYADAYVGLGWTYMNDFLWGWTEWLYRALDRSKTLAERAIALDERNASAHALLALALRWRQQYEQAQREIERAIELNPNSALSHAVQGTLLVWDGQLEAAVRPLELALRLDPHPIAWSVVSLAQAYYLLGRYNEVVRLLDPYQGRFREDPEPFALLAAAHGQLGNSDAASDALERLHSISPFFDAELYAGNLAVPEHGRHLLQGLRKAGLKL